MATIYRGSLIFRDNESGLGFSLNCYRQHDDPDDFLAAADAFMDGAEAALYNSIQVIGLRVENPEVPGEYTEYSGDAFIHGFGLGSVGIVPLAEAALLAGDDAGPFVRAHTNWWLHGLDTGTLNAAGAIDQGDAAVIALKNAAKVYLLAYRKEATPVKGLPEVTPPQAFPEFAVKGPYVRRVGVGFTRPGQRRS